MGKTRRTPLTRDHMNRRVHSATASMTLAEVVAFLGEHEISSAPVVEVRAGRRVLIGYVSEHDCLDVLANELFHGSPAPSRTVASFMRRHPVCVSPDTDVFTLASILVHHRMRHLPVVDGDELLGIVSRRDVLRCLEGYYRDLLEDTDRRLHPPDLHEIANLRFVVSGR